MKMPLAVEIALSFRRLSLIHLFLLYSIVIIIPESLCTANTQGDGGEIESKPNCVNPIPPGAFCPPSGPILGTSTTTTTTQPPPTTSTRWTPATSKETRRPTSTTTSTSPAPTTSKTSQPSGSSTTTTTLTTTTTSMTTARSTTPPPPASEGDEPGNEYDHLRNKDPFFRTPQAEQLKCTSTGLTCNTNCSWVDWLKVYNKTIDGSRSAAKEEYDNVSLQTCFQRCNLSSCVLYTFSELKGTCKIYDEFKFENLRNDTDSSLYVRISPEQLFLSEWIISRDLQPRGEPITTFELPVPDFLNCTLLCADVAQCVFAVLDRNKSTCDLYSNSATQLTSLKSNLVSIQHISSKLGGSNLWRFRSLGNIFQQNNSRLAFTTESLENCLDSCYARDSCLMATTTSSNRSTVDCFLYDNFQNVWFEDEPPSRTTNSFLKAVPKNNTFFKRLPHFISIAPTSVPMETVSATDLGGCHERAMKSDSTYFYTYNETLQRCNLYDNSVQMWKDDNSTSYELTTFSKSIPTKDYSHYAFNSFWMSKSSLATDPPESLSQTVDGNCLKRCLDLESCNGVAIQRPEGNCTLYSRSSLLSIGNRTNLPGLQQIQMYIKSDFKFEELENQYICSDKQLVTWDKINHILQFDSLDNARDNIPVGNNGPLTPHGPGFEGQGNGTTTQVEVKTTTPPQKRDNAHVSYLWMEGRKGREHIIEEIFLTSVIGGASMGAVAGVPVVGAVAGAIAGGIGVIVCLFKGCNKEKEEESCEKSCQRRAIDRFLFAVRAVSCKCTTQPGVTPAWANLEATDEEEADERLQEDCTDKSVGETCQICCRAGYEAENDPVCGCVSKTSAGWRPNPVRCIPRTDCGIGGAHWGGLVMPKLKVMHCLYGLYYGLVFNTRKRIPFYSVYNYGYTNRDRDRAGLRGNSWLGLGCTDVALGQLTQEDYTVINAYHRYPAEYFDRGHLTPNADVRWRIDAMKSTFVFANAAPQDHYTNSNPWNYLEDGLRTTFRENLPDGRMRQGYVITGTCLEDDEEYAVPDCFWKLVCTQTDSYEVTVAGFWHDNTIVNINDGPARLARSAQVFQIRDQDNMPNIGLGTGVSLRAFWTEAADFFVSPFDKVALANCRSANNINFPSGHIPSVKADEDYELYNFWNEKVNKEGFVENLTGEDEEETTAESESGSPPSCGKKVVGYVTGWSDVKFTERSASYLTHVIFAFVQMHEDGVLSVGSADPENSKNATLDTRKSYLRLYEIKAAKAKSGFRLRTIFAVGGWANSQYFSKVAGSEQLTLNFIRSALDILDYFDMDGIDIDWEYPVTGGANEGVKEDRENSVDFLSSLSAALDNHRKEKGRSEPYTLTIAGAAGSWVLEDGFNLELIAAVVDWINVMTYDYYGAWDSKWGAYTGPHAPLYFGAPQGYSGKTNVDYTLKYYSCRIQNPEKLVMGLGFYGRFWNHSGSPVGTDPLWRKAVPNGAGKFDGGFEPWRNIAANYWKNPEFKKSFHNVTKTPYLENSAGFLMGYEDPKSIHAKVMYAAVKNFGGVMIWAVDLDDESNTLLRISSSESLCAGAPDGVGSEYKCSPIQEQRWWTLLDDEKKAGMCGKSAPLYKGYYPVCDPEDPGYACCSPSGFCGSGDNYCKCDGCVDYYEYPEKILDEPVKPSGPVRWHTMDKFEEGPQCGYNGHKLENGDFAICNPDNDNGYCCSAAGYCGITKEFCECEGCVNFKENPDFEYPEKTWIDSGPEAGMCGDNAQVNGKPATCNPMSNDYHCCSASGYCGAGEDYCDCDGCVNFKQ